MLDRFEKCFCLNKEYKHVANNASFYTERNGTKLTIYFEKSNGKVDWINNFDFNPKCIDTTDFAPTESTIAKTILSSIKEFIFEILNPPKKAYKDSADGWKCHSGFLKVWKSIEPYLVDQINNPMIKEFEVIGYSHGGAIAQLCYEYIKYYRPDAKASGYGFGAPRIFYGKPSDAVKKRFKGFVVVRNGKDLITHLPPKCFGFIDICEVKEVGEYSCGLIKDHYPERYWIALWKEKYGSPLGEAK